MTDPLVAAGHAQITFKPDLARFGMEALEEDIMALMRRRVYDMAGVLGKQIKVTTPGPAVPSSASAAAES